MDLAYLKKSLKVLTYAQLHVLLVLSKEVLPLSYVQLSEASGISTSSLRRKEMVRHLIRGRLVAGVYQERSSGQALLHFEITPDGESVVSQLLTDK